MVYTCIQVKATNTDGDEEMLLNHQGTAFTKDQAESVANTLNADNEDDWEYRVKHDPKGTGCSLVEVYDEDGFLLGKV